MKLCLLARASRTTPTSARTMPPSHLTAKRHRRRTRRRRAVASQTTSAMRPPRRRGGRRVPAAGPSSVAGPARPSWPARLPTREDRAGGQILGKMPCLPILHGDFTSERVGSTTPRLHQRVRLAILYRIDTWYVFSIARGEELRPFLSSVYLLRENPLGPGRQHTRLDFMAGRLGPGVGGRVGGGAARGAGFAVGSLLSVETCSHRYALLLWGVLIRSDSCADTCVRDCLC